MLVFYACSESSRKGSIWDYHFWLCVWSVKLLVKLDCRILWSTISLKRIIWFLSFFMELVISDQICAPGQIGLQDFLVINTPGRNQFIPLSFFFIYFFASFIKLCRSPFGYDVFTLHHSFWGCHNFLGVIGK